MRLLLLLSRYDTANEYITIELRNQENIKTLGEMENQKHLGILVDGTIKQTEMKDKMRQDYFKRIRKLFDTKLCITNLIKEINIWAVPLVRTSVPFLKRAKKELR